MAEKGAEQCWLTIEVTDTGEVKVVKTQEYIKYADQTTERVRNMLSFLKLTVRRIMVVKEAILMLHK